MELADNDKKDEFKQERMFGVMAKIPIANTFSELTEMDFVDYGDYGAFLHIQDTLRRFPVIICWAQRRRRKNKRRKW